MNIGVAGDRLSLARVIGAMVVVAALLGAIGYAFDLLIGPLISMGGWWTVFATGGFILGGMLQAAREFAVPSEAERESIEEETAARVAAGVTVDDEDDDEDLDDEDEERKG